MPKTRALCCLCQNVLEHNGEKYTGIRFARSLKKTEIMARHLGLSLNQMGNFKNYAEICHRHYVPSTFYFEARPRAVIKQSLVISGDILPIVADNDISRLQMQQPPPMLPLPGVNSLGNQIIIQPNGRTIQPGSTVAHLASSDVDYLRPVINTDTTSNDQPDVFMDDFTSHSPHFISEDQNYDETESESLEIPKFLLVEGNQLLQLVKYCFSCGTSVTATPTKTICGTAITIKFYCKTCKCYKSWSSQSKVENTNRFLGNVLIPSTAVLTPINYPSLSEFSQTLGLPMIKWSTFNRVARSTHTVIVDKWRKMQDKIVANIIKKQEEGEDTCVSADCQYDSRGYCASQGCETLMCSKTKLVITGHVLERSETKNNSGAMEVEGLKRCLEELEFKGVEVKVLTTDRGKSVITYMSKFPRILHLFDSWHLFKSLNKSFREAAKLKTALEMKVWIGPLLNHMWHSVKAANGDGSQCIQFMMTSLIHSLGVHEWQPGRLEDVLREVHSKFTLTKSEKLKYKKNNPSLIGSSYVKNFQMAMSRCPHSYRPSNIVEDNRLPVFSKVYNVILKTLTREGTVKDMMRVSPNLTTSALENLHSLITGKYRPKEVYFPKNQSMVLTYLAYYHHNMNIYDEMEGKRFYVRKRLVKSRQKGGELVVKYVKHPSDLSWKVGFNDELLRRYSNNMFNISNNFDLDDNDEVELVQNITAENGFVEVLMDDIMEGNLPLEFVDLMQEEEESEEN